MDCSTGSVNKKGFTFKRSGLHKPPLSGSTTLASCNKPIGKDTILTHSVQNECTWSNKPIISQSSGSLLQPSIEAFMGTTCQTTKSRPVAAIAPHRSPVKDDGLLGKGDTVFNISNTLNSYTPSVAYFRTCPVSTITNSSSHIKNEVLSQKAKVREVLRPNITEEEDYEDDIRVAQSNRKRPRRSCFVIISDDESDEESKSTKKQATAATANRRNTQTSSYLSQPSPCSSQPDQNRSFSTPRTHLNKSLSSDVVNRSHSESRTVSHISNTTTTSSSMPVSTTMGLKLARSSQKLSNKVERQDLDHDLFDVMDETCEIISTISSARLMDAALDQYERLQQLLAKRKRLKDSLSKLSADPVMDISSLEYHERPSSACNCLTPLNHKTLGSVPPVEMTRSWSSPIPCGESFFENDSTLSNVKNSSVNPCNSNNQSANPISGDIFHESFNESWPEEDEPSVGRSSRPLLSKSTKTQDNSQRSFIYSNYPSYHDAFSNDFPDDFDLELEEQMREDFTGYVQESPEKAAVKSRDKTPISTTKLKSCDDDDFVEAYEHYEPIFSNDDMDSGPEFARTDYPHSQEMQRVFRSVFGLRNFRQNQLEALNAALLGHDCFVLMPTGGGKSLCYQLPALVSRGVTIVISPLRALIQDQVARLISFGIQAAHLSSDVTLSQSDLIYTQLCYYKPAIKLLYVTPEKISASGKLMSAFENLYARQMLDRFIIDEAHCVSQWGHDFRPDYKKLNVLRQKFPEVAMMALTATATPRVRKDIVHQLHMHNPKWFMQSFNRPNLKYSVLSKKPKNLTQEIIELIKKKFPLKYGIIYCLSRKECDTVAQDLKRARIQAEAYHAGLKDNERLKVQERWISGDNCKVICATIAFGMGIDKPDVRYVIHFCLPKSVEGYYQEAGRAGRDGLIAHCILYYTYQDVIRIRRMIETDEAANLESKKVHRDNLFRMVRYCENQTDCRRAQILQYFGESYFDKRWCNNVRGSLCDNCDSEREFIKRDVTGDCKEIVKCVQSLRGNQRITLIHLAEIFKGSKNTKVVQMGHDKLPLHGQGSAYDRLDVDRLLHKLVADGLLAEELHITAHDHAVCYIRPGKFVSDLLSGVIKVELDVQLQKKGQSRASIGQVSRSDRDVFEEECYNELIDIAKSLAKEHGVTNYATVFPNLLLRTMARLAPTTDHEMCDIDGLPQYKYDKYGCVKFLEVTSKYAELYSSLEESSTKVRLSEDIENLADGTSPYFSPNIQKAKSNRFRKKFSKWNRGKKKTGNYSNTGYGQSSKNAKWTQKKATNNKTSSTAKSRQSAGPGMMPAPQPMSRSFLGGKFSYK